MLGAVRSRHCGLTLIELLVTVAIVAIMAVIALPSFQSTLSRNRLSGAAESLAQDMYLARSQAMEDSCTITLTFTPASTSAWSYSITKPSSSSNCLNPCSAAGAADCTLKTVTGSNFSGITLPSTTFASNAVSYDPVRSTASAAGDVLLSASSTGDAVKVQLGAVGKVSICTSAGSGGYAACPP